LKSKHKDSQSRREKYQNLTNDLRTVLFVVEIDECKFIKTLIINVRKSFLVNVL